MQRQGISPVRWLKCDNPARERIDSASRVTKSYLTLCLSFTKRDALTDNYQCSLRLVQHSVAQWKMSLPRYKYFRLIVQATPSFEFRICGVENTKGLYIEVIEYAEHRK